MKDFKNRQIDLHMHTDGSDGTWTVEELKEELIKNNISIFSITDHDEIDNIAKMEKILKPEDDMIFIKGVEATASFQDREYHLPVYNYDSTNEPFIKFLNWSRDLRLDFNRRFVKYMETINPNVSYRDFVNYKEDPGKGGWKSANYMLDRKIHRNMAEHFEDVKNSGLSITFKSPEEVISLGKKSGGYVFLAHPSYHYREEGMPLEELKMWVELGIDGIECFTPYNNHNQADYYVDFCKKNNLMISGGSDCHGEFIPGRFLGVP